LVSVVSDFAKAYGEFRDTVSVSLYTLINAMQKYLNLIDERLGRQTAVGVKAESFRLSLPRLEEDREFSSRFIVEGDMSEEDSDISLSGIQGIFGESRGTMFESSGPSKQAIVDQWGGDPQIEEVGDGIYDISTDGHGGIWLAAAQNKLIPAQFRSKGGWYEEDSDRWIVVHFLSDMFHDDNPWRSERWIKQAQERIDSGKPNFNKSR
jgi:hypothetical protein